MSLGEKISLIYFYRTFKGAGSPLPAVGILHNWLTRGKRVDLEDEEEEISDRAFIRGSMWQYIREKVESRVGPSWQFLTIVGNAATKQNWKLDDIKLLNVDFWLYQTRTVRVLGHIEARTDTHNGQPVICYRNLETSWRWEDNIDANSFRESWNKGQYTNALEHKDYLQAPFNITAAIVENATDIVNEKIAGADFPISVNWRFDSESGKWFTFD